MDSKLVNKRVSSKPAAMPTLDEGEDDGSEGAWKVWGRWEEVGKGRACFTEEGQGQGGA